MNIILWFLKFIYMPDFTLRLVFWKWIVYFEYHDGEAKAEVLEKKYKKSK